MHLETYAVSVFLYLSREIHTQTHTLTPSSYLFDLKWAQYPPAKLVKRIMQGHFEGQLLTALCLPATNMLEPRLTECTAQSPLRANFKSAQPSSCVTTLIYTLNWIFCMYFLPPTSQLTHFTILSSEALSLVRERWTNGPRLSSLSSEAISSPWKARKAEKRRKGRSFCSLASIFLLLLLGITNCPQSVGYPFHHTGPCCL